MISTRRFCRIVLERDKLVLVQVEIQKSHIAGLAATKLHGLVVMMLGWHAKGPGFESCADPIKLLLHKSWAPSIGRNSKGKKAAKCLTPEIGLGSIFRSLMSSSKNQTNTLAAKKYWMKFFAPFIRPQVEPFPHNKHPMEHGCAFLIAYSCAIGQLQ